LLRYGGRSALTVPLVIKGMSIGYADLWESRRRRDFTSEEIALCVRSPNRPRSLSRTRGYLPQHDNGQSA